jgi:penicillin-binding protein 1A
LGTEVLTPLELTAAYVPFANGGVAITPYGFKRIRTRTGKILWERSTPAPRRAIEDAPLRSMNTLLAQVISAGTARGAQLPDRPVGGKTGTTSDYRDAWFIGFTGGYVAGVWVGNDDFGIKTNKVTGGSAPTRIWKAFMSDAMRGQPARGFPMMAKDEQTNQASLNADSGGLDEIASGDVPIAVTAVEAPQIDQPLPANNDTSLSDAGASNGQLETRTLDQIVRDAQAQAVSPAPPQSPPS